MIRFPCLAPRIAAAGLALVMTGLLVAPAIGQEARIGFSSLRQDPSAPVEVTADQLRVDQSTGLAVFEGSVLALQGALRLTADKVEVEYATGAEGGIRRLIGTGNVLLETGLETAAGDGAIYDIATGMLEMSGNVRLTQGSTVIEGPRLVADLVAGTGVMEGRVRTTFVPTAGGGGN
jgi:lipopolysaccharide export system protein LptA